MKQVLFGSWFRKVFVKLISSRNGPVNSTETIKAERSIHKKTVYLTTERWRKRKTRRLYYTLASSVYKA